MKMFLSNIKAFHLVTILWILAIIFINPTGEFAINDDWAFARSVNNYNNGDYKICDWLAMTAFSHVIWGSLWTKLFGFSFTILRISTLVLSFIGIITFNSILNEFKLNKSLKILGLTIFAFNPIYFHLSYSYMSDVPAIVYSLITFWSLLKYLKTKNKLYYIISLGSLSIGILLRQDIIIIPTAFFLYNFFNKQESNRFRQFVISTIPIIFSLIVLLSFEAFSDSLGNKPVHFNFHTALLFNKLIKGDAILTFKMFIYHISSICFLSGLILLPITIQHKIKNVFKNKAALFVFTLLTSLQIIKLITDKSITPFIGDVFHIYGFGPIIESGFQTNLIKPESIFQKALWSFLSILGAYSFSLYASTFSLKNRSFIYYIIYITLLFLIYLSPVSMSDRYILSLITYSIVLLICHYKLNINLKTNFAICSLCILFSLFLEKDFFSEKTARLRALHYLQSELNCPNKEINAGFEFNGYHFYNAEEHLKASAKNMMPWWWRENHKYIISAKKNSNLIPLKKICYLSLTNCERKEIWVMLNKSLKEPPL